MKTIKTTVLTNFILTIGLVACNDDFLQEEPKSFLSPNVTYTTDAGLAAGGVGFFDEISLVYFNSALMRDYMSLANAGTDFMQNGQEPSHEDIVALTDSYSPTTSDENLTDLWSHYFSFGKQCDDHLRGKCKT